MAWQPATLPIFDAKGDHFVEVNGINLHYLDTGGDGRPVVLLHGVNQNVRTWELVLPSLAGPWRLIALDQRGHGLSDEGQMYKRGDIVQDCRAFIEALGLERPVVVGHSLGGYVGLRVAISYPNLVGALVIGDMSANPAASIASERRLSMQRLLAPGLGDATWADEAEALAFRQKYNPGEPEAISQLRLRHQLRRRPDGRLEMARAAFVARALLAEVQTFDATPHLANVQCPVLVIRAEQSDVLPADAAEKMVKALPNAHLAVIADCPHDLQLYQPQRFGDAVARFLREVAP